MRQQTDRIVLARRPEGRPVGADFRIESVDLPEMGEGDVLLATRWIGIDPMIAILIAERPFGGAMPGLPLGSLIPGAAVSQVVMSRHSAFASGDWVEGRSGWQTACVMPAAQLRRIDAANQQAALGILGLSGFTAWCGLQLAGELAGKMVLISGASGAVGSVAGQLARLRGASVVGLAGSAERCRFLVEELGFAKAIDRSSLVGVGRLAQHVVGVDIYFDNVGGPLIGEVLGVMNRQGKVLICGLMAAHGELLHDATGGVDVLTPVMAKSLSITGFNNRDFLADFAQFEAEVAPLIASGQLREDYVLRDGLSGVIAHFTQIFEGSATGKRLARIGTEAEGPSA